MVDHSSIYPTFIVYTLLTEVSMIRGSLVSGWYKSLIEQQHTKRRLAPFNFARTNPTGYVCFLFYGFMSVRLRDKPRMNFDYLAVDATAPCLAA